MCSWFYLNLINNHRYQSTYMGSFQTVELIETFLNYQVCWRYPEVMCYLVSVKTSKCLITIYITCDLLEVQPPSWLNFVTWAWIFPSESFYTGNHNLINEGGNVKQVYRYQKVMRMWYNFILFYMCMQENIKRCVCIIYDPLRSSQGVLALKALKLTESFMDLYKSQNFTGEKCVGWTLTVNL